MNEKGLVLLVCLVVDDLDRNFLACLTVIKGQFTLTRDVVRISDGRVRAVTCAAILSPVFDLNLAITASFTLDCYCGLP